MSDDSDFEEQKPKKAPAVSKGNPLKTYTQTKITTLVSPPKSKVFDYSRSRLLMKVNTDGASDDPVSRSETASVSGSQREKKPAPKPSSLTIKDDSESDEVISKPTNRAARAVTKKPASYVMDLDSDSDNGDGLLADLGNMVKGLPKSAESGSESNTRALFSTSTSRPSSSHGAFKLPSKPEKKLSDDLSMSDDETDYKSLAPQQSPRRSILVTNKDNTTFDLSDEDDKPVIPKPKPAAKPKAARPKKDAADKEPKAKKPAAKKAPVAKNVDQSPIAKAYAKRLAKKKNINSDDDMDADDLANDILDSPGASESDAPVSKKPTAARPARRAATTINKAAKYTFDDDSDDEDGGFNDDDDDDGDEASGNFSDSD